MKDSVKELRQDIGNLEVQLNELLDVLIKDYPDFSFSLTLEDTQTLGRRKRVIIEPELKGHR